MKAIQVTACLVLSLAFSACIRKEVVLSPLNPDYVPRTNEASHVVQPDQDLYTVAMLWGVSIPALQKRNGIEGTDLTVGQMLVIPPEQPFPTNVVQVPKDFVLCVEEP